MITSAEEELIEEFLRKARVIMKMPSEKLFSVKALSYTAKVRLYSFNFHIGVEATPTGVIINKFPYVVGNGLSVPEAILYTFMSEGENAKLVKRQSLYRAGDNSWKEIFERAESQSGEANFMERFGLKVTEALQEKVNSPSFKGDVDKQKSKLETKRDKGWQKRAAARVSEELARIASMTEAKGLHLTREQAGPIITLAFSWTAQVLSEDEVLRLYREAQASAMLRS